MFCEDEPSIRRLIEVTLRASPHEVHIAEDGQIGLTLVERLRPDAVFVDLRMPGLDGYALHEAIRTRPHLAGVPVAIITASTQRGELEKARDRGVATVLLKPFSPAGLRAAVDRVLGAAAGTSPFVQEALPPVRYGLAHHEDLCLGSPC